MISETPAAKTTTSYKAKCCSVIFLFVMSAFNLFSQDPIKEANLELRHFFQYTYLASPAPPVDYLYDLSVKFTDPRFYADISNDTIHTGAWLKLYEEMWWAAYDTTALPKSDTVLDKGMSYNGDTIPMGIMAFKYWQLKHNALTTNIYFNFDTVNNVITDKPNRPSSPYLDSTLFSVCPLKSESFFKDPVFRIDPDLIFNDVHNQNLFDPSTHDFLIDFGDGSNYITVDPTQISHIPISYSSNGIKTISAIVIATESGETVRKSTSQIVIMHDFERQEPDCILPTTPGLTAGIYKGCKSSGCEELRKPIVYIRGYDILDNPLFPNTDIAEIYTDIGLDQKLADLRNYEYDLVIVEFDNITIDLRHNAAYLTNLMDILKQRTEGTDDQMVVIGHSTGALIARLCLTYMESSYYQSQDLTPLTNTPNPISFNLDNWNQPELMHKTRTYISFDGPQQGANFPMAYQTLYTKVLNFAAMTSSLGALARRFIKAANMFLDAPAAQQMMIYHISTKSGGGLYKNYSSHWRRDDYLQHYDTWGISNYPEFCKNVAIANGSFNGIRQRNFYTDLQRVAGDYFVDSEAEIYGRILGIKVPLFGYSVELKSNNSTSHFFQMSAGTYSPKIKPYWFGIKIKWGYNSMFSSLEYGNLDPHCTDAGGFYGLENPDNDSWYNQTGTNDYALSSYYALNIFQYNFNTGSGCESLSSHVGWNGFLSANLKYETCTDGIQFNLVPTFSAFDLAGAPRNANVSSQPLSAWLSQTPFDVLVTSVEPEIVLNPNRFHRDFNNYAIITGAEDDKQVWLLENCIFGEERDSVRLINREIGEETMYVDNLVLNRPAEFQALYDLYVNVFNPFYKYISNPNPYSQDGLVPGTYSRANTFQTVPNGYTGTLYPVTFSTGSGSSSGGQGFLYEGDQVELWEHRSGSYTGCCIDYYQKSAVAVRQEETKEPPSEVTVYPNPVHENSFSTVIKLASPTKSVLLKLYDMQGRLLYQKEYQGSFEGEVHVRSNVSSNLPSGLYSLLVLCDNDSFEKKIIIQ